LPEGVKRVDITCPGHDGRCPFCKQEKMPMPYIDSITGKPLENYCCRYCKSNDVYADRIRDEFGKKRRDVHKWR
jgi:hypothetical protein